MERDTMRLAGCLFWTERDGEIYVLLSLPETNSPFFPAGYYSIPSGFQKAEESGIDASMRIGFEKTGVLDNRSRAKLFWSTGGNGLDYSIYSLKVSPSVKAGGNSRWIRLDGSLEDVSALARFQLETFRSSQEARKAV